MIKKFGRVACGLAAGAALALGAATPALAGSSAGTLVINVTNQCFLPEFPGDTTLCQDQHDVLHGVLTPSGNEFQLETGHATERLYLNGQLIATTQGRVSTTTLFKSGTTQVDRLVGQTTATFPDGTTCRITSHYHFANGQLQYDSATDTCSAPV